MTSFGYIYITTNLVNGKKYLGMCRYGKRNESTYFGSGKLITAAIKKYGIEQFKKDIIEVCNSREELSIREIYYITEFNCVDSSDWYNVAPGGYATRGFQGKTHSDETKMKMKLNHKRPITDKVRAASKLSIKEASRHAVTKNKQRFDELGFGYRASKVEVDGTMYNSVKHYADVMGISPSSASTRLKNMKLGKRRFSKQFSVDGIIYNSVASYADFLGIGWRKAARILDDMGIDFRPSPENKK